MHPAKSVIFFTTASGAGYGLIAIIIIANLSGQITANIGFDPCSFHLLSFAIAFILITAGLLSSTFHLGQPKRALMSFSQWRTSWLSREAVMAVVTYITTGIYAVYFCFSLDVLSSKSVIILISTAALLSCAITIFCTSMIYASLRPIHAWSNKFTPIGYLILALMSGSILFAAILHIYQKSNIIIDTMAIIFLIIGLIFKLRYWYFIDNNKSQSNINSATGLGNGGKKNKNGKIAKVNMLEAPHSQNNYLLNEMGFKIARSHAKSLRRLTIILGFIAPIILFVMVLANGQNILISQIMTINALFLTAIGIFCERWLFFAEAKHTVTLYYGSHNV